MNTGILRSPYKGVRRQFYRAALFESDASKVSGRIAEAETALVTRARELFHAAGDNIEQEQAVDEAMYALHAFRSALKCRSKAKSASQDLPPEIWGSAGNYIRRSPRKEHL
jgi:hypothetical protein